MVVKEVLESLPLLLPPKLLKHQVAEALGCRLATQRDGRNVYWTCGCVELRVDRPGPHGTLLGGIFDYPASWEHTGPWIEKLGMKIHRMSDGTWCSCDHPTMRGQGQGKTVLEAVCNLIVKL